MKKKLTMILLALALCTTSLFTVDMKANAKETEEEVTYESLLTEDALIGNMQSQTWGVYLVDGTSIINDAGGGKIGAGGSTTAAKKCKVSVNVVVERKVGTSWVRVTSWTATNTNALVVSTGKTISVASGYYYRVRCNHAAASDGSSSCTGALWM
jgi:hypothetical protein